jgi:hypothetical protein
MVEMLKAVATIVMVVCAGVMIYTIGNAIYTYKKNKETDEAIRKLFMAKMSQNTKTPKPVVEAPAILKKPLKEIEPNKPKALNYDEFNTDDVDVDTSGRGINDFFKKQG